VGRSKSQCRIERVDRIGKKEKGGFEKLITLWSDSEAKAEDKKRDMRSGKRRHRNWKNMAGTEEKREENGKREQSRAESQTRTIIVIYVVQKPENKVTIMLQNHVELNEMNDEMWNMFDYGFCLKPVGCASCTHVISSCTPIFYIKSRYFTLLSFRFVRKIILSHYS